MKARLMMKIKDATEKCGEIVQVESDDLVFVAELKNCTSADLKEDEEIDVDVKFFCHNLYGTYKSEEEYEEENKGMAVMSYMPIGAMPEMMGNGEPSPMNYLNMVVDEIVDNEEIGAPEQLLLLYGNIYDSKLDVIIKYDDPEEKYGVEPGDIVSGAFWAELRLIKKQ